MVPFTESWAVLTSALEGVAVAVEAVVGVGVGEVRGFVAVVVGVGVDEAPGFVPPHAATDNAMRMMTADHHGNASAEQAAPVEGIKPIPQLFSGTRSPGLPGNARQVQCFLGNRTPIALIRTKAANRQCPSAPA